MRRICIVGFVLGVLGAPWGVLHAEQEVVFNLEKRGLGGYGGPRFQATTLNGKFAVIGGGPFMLVIKPSYGVGLRIAKTEGSAGGIDLSYVGLQTEYILRYNKPVYFTVGTFMGGGTLVYEDPDSTTTERFRSGLFILEPEILLNVRLFTYLRLDLGGSYRFAAGVKGIPGIDSRDVQGFTLMLQLIYGWF